MVQKYSFYNGLSPINLTWAVHNVIAQLEGSAIRLTWENPVSPLFSFVKVVKKTLGYSEGLYDPKNIIVYEGTAQELLDSNNLEPLETYYYTVYGINGSLTGEEWPDKWLWTNAQNLDSITGNFDFLNIHNEPSEGTTSATVQILTGPKRMQLIVVGGYDAMNEIIDLTAAPTDTMSELVDYINSTIQKNWIVNRICKGTHPSANLLPTVVIPCMGEGAQVILPGEYPIYAPINPDMTKITNSFNALTVGKPASTIFWAWDYDSQVSVLVGEDFDFTELIYGES